MRLMKGYDPDHKMYLLDLFDKSWRGDSHFLISVRHCSGEQGLGGGGGLRAVCGAFCLPPLLAFSFQMTENCVSEHPASLMSPAL